MSFLEDKPLTTHVERVQAEEELLEAVSEFSIEVLRFLTYAGPRFARAFEQGMERFKAEAVAKLRDKKS